MAEFRSSLGTSLNLEAQLAEPDEVLVRWLAERVQEQAKALALQVWAEVSLTGQATWNHRGLIGASTVASATEQEAQPNEASKNRL
jgi:hypothetical protein